MRTDCSILNKSFGHKSQKLKKISQVRVATHFAYFSFKRWNRLVKFVSKVVAPSGRMQFQVCLAGTIDRIFFW